MSASINEIEAENDRFHRVNLVWERDRLKNARVVVIGAGALGNEIIKNLALLGVGNVFVADSDKIENSNLSRTVLYREVDIGKSKAETAAVRAKEIYPEMNVHYFDGNILYDLGVGVYRWANVVIGGLDNREARLSINRNCWKIGRPWVNGGIEAIDGVVNIFDPTVHPHGPCYECTLTSVARKLLRERKSCNGLTREEMLAGKIPTTSTISSIIAGIQCQEAVKLLHNNETIAGKGFYFRGITCDSYLRSYTPAVECISHDSAQEIISLSGHSNAMTVKELQALAAEKLGEGTQLEFGQEILEKFICSFCKREEEVFSPLGKVFVSQGICPDCGNERMVKTFYTVGNDVEFGNKTLAQIGVPQFDIVWARNWATLIGFEFSGDAPGVLGSLHFQE